MSRVARTKGIAIAPTPVDASMLKAKLLFGTNHSLSMLITGKYMIVKPTL